MSAAYIVEIAPGVYRADGNPTRGREWARRYSRADAHAEAGQLRADGYNSARVLPAEPRAGGRKPRAQLTDDALCAQRIRLVEIAHAAGLGLTPAQPSLDQPEAPFRAADLDRILGLRQQAASAWRGVPRSAACLDRWAARAAAYRAEQVRAVEAMRDLQK